MYEDCKQMPSICSKSLYAIEAVGKGGVFPLWFLWAGFAFPRRLALLRDRGRHGCGEDLVEGLQGIAKLLGRFSHSQGDWGLAGPWMV